MFHATSHARWPAPWRLVGPIASALLAACLLASCAGGSPAAPGGVRPDTARAGLDTVDLVLLAPELEAAMPRLGSGGYVVPSADALATFEVAVDRLAAGRVSAADSLLDRFGYDAREVVEAASGVRLALVRERTPVARGWGTYVLDAASATGVDVHVNHPISDANTTRIGAALFRQGRFRWLLVAGAHRDANPDDQADMARQAASVFERVHERVAPSGRVAVSVHGFARGNHVAPIDTSDVVLSEGQGATTANATPAALALRDRLRAAGFRTGLYPVDPGFAALGATLNPQGRFTNASVGRGRWIHVESAAEVRGDPARWAVLVDALVAWTREGR